MRENGFDEAGGPTVIKSMIELVLWPKSIGWQARPYGEPAASEFCSNNGFSIDLVWDSSIFGPSLRNT
jgi:hypothetical protein